MGIDVTIRKRPAIWIAEGVLGTGLIVALLYHNQEAVMAIIVAIAGTLHKMVESEEKN